MARPANPNRKDTPVMLPKSLKLRIRRHAKSATNRKGTESDAQIIERVFTEYEKTLTEPLGEPKSTY